MTTMRSFLGNLRGQHCEKNQTKGQLAPQGVAEKEGHAQSQHGRLDEVAAKVSLCDLQFNNPDLMAEASNFAPQRKNSRTTARNITCFRPSGATLPTGRIRPRITIAISSSIQVSMPNRLR